MPIFIITGRQGAGKTTRLRSVVGELKHRKQPVHGFFAHGKWEGNRRSSFYLEDLNSGAERLLCTTEPVATFEKQGRFFFDLQSIAWGEELLRSGQPGNLLVIDEIGRFELENKVWSGIFRDCLELDENPLLITVRDRFLAGVLDHYGISASGIFNLNLDTRSVADEVLKGLSQNK